MQKIIIVAIPSKQKQKHHTTAEEKSEKS